MGWPRWDQAPITITSFKRWYGRNRSQHSCPRGGAGLPGGSGLTGRAASNPTTRCLVRSYQSWLGIFFFSPETRLLSKSPCLKVSQSETACFNSQKPFGFLHCAVSTSLRFLWWQRPQRLRSATLPVCCIDDFQTKNPVISLPSSLTQYLQICKSYAGGPLPVIPSTVDIDFHNEQK